MTKTGDGRGAARQARAAEGEIALMKPGRLVLFGIAGMVVLAATVLAAIVYAVWTIDSIAMDAETARAEAALSAVIADGAMPEAATAARLDSDFSLEGARFTTSAVLRSGEIAIPLTTTGGRIMLLAWMPHRLGTEVFTTLAPLRLAASGALLLVIGVILYQFYRLTSALEARHSAARKLADEDILTGLSNRLVFDDRLKAAFAGEAGASNRFALLYIDLDGFKQVNDTRGHGVGDTLLKRVAERLSEFGREGDTVARIGGDEFALLRTDYESRGAIEELAGDIGLRLLAPYVIEGEEVTIGASIGIALGPVQTEGAEALVEAADKALYSAKSKGGGTFVVAGDVVKPRRKPRAA